MQYVTKIEDPREKSTMQAAHAQGVMLQGVCDLLREKYQRLLMQSLLITPPTCKSDDRLVQLLCYQTALWQDKIASCAHAPLCIRLPDCAVHHFLPKGDTDYAKLAAYMGCDLPYVRTQANKLQPDASILCNAYLLATFLRALFSAAERCHITKLSILLPFVSHCQQAHDLQQLLQQDARLFGIDCTIGIEIDTPHAACVASQLAAYADVVIFNVDEIMHLLYGESTASRYSVHNDLDMVGTGTLLHIAMQQVRSTQPQVRLGVAGAPAFTQNGRTFCQALGVDLLIAESQSTMEN